MLAALAGFVHDRQRADGHEHNLERGQETFHSVHVESAQRVAAQAQRSGLKRRSISESAVRANWRFGRPLLMPF
jgi:hypothetical protein